MTTVIRMSLNSLFILFYFPFVCTGNRILDNLKKFLSRSSYDSSFPECIVNVPPHSTQTAQHRTNCTTYIYIFIYICIVVTVVIWLHFARMCCEQGTRATSLRTNCTTLILCMKFNHHKKQGAFVEWQRTLNTIFKNNDKETYNLCRCLLYENRSLYHSYKRHLHCMQVSFVWM